MNIKVRQIEVDEKTAELLEERAAACGISVSQLLSEIANSDQPSNEAEALAELERRSNAANASGATVPHDKVVRWLQTWGTPDFKPWRDQ